MQAVFVHQRLDPGQVGDLMDQRGRVGALQRLAAPPAGIGLAISGRAELLGGDQGAERLAMARLTAALPPGRWSRWLSFQPDGIRGGRLGGVGGIELEPGLEIAHCGLQFGDLILDGFPGVQERGLGVGGHGAPEWFRDRNPAAHM